jgi:uncharacterized membrane protein YkoI
MSIRRTLSLIAALALGTAAAASAQATGTQPAQHRTTAQGQGRGNRTAAKPAISRDSARVLALANMPGATVRSEKLQRHQGRRVYVFSLRSSDNKAQHLWVDANTGEIVTPPASTTRHTGAKSRSTTHRATSDTSSRRPPKQ